MIKIRISNTSLYSRILFIKTLMCRRHIYCIYNKKDNASVCRSVCDTVNVFVFLLYLSDVNTISIYHRILLADLSCVETSRIMVTTILQKLLLKCIKRDLTANTYSIIITLKRALTCYNIMYHGYNFIQKLLLKFIKTDFIPCIYFTSYICVLIKCLSKILNFVSVRKFV